MNRFRLLRFVCTLALLYAAPAVAQEDLILQKGTSARKPGHFTRYSPPALEELSPNLKVHIIQRGDTLWDLAKTYLGDYYFWPQLWQENPYITDPHWIYPEDPLVIPQPMLVADATPPEPQLNLRSLPPPQPVAKRYDVYCAPYILAKGTDDGAMTPSYDEVEQRLVNGFGMIGGPDRRHRDAAGKTELARTTPQVVAGELGRSNLAEGDVLYINRGELHGVRAGDEFMVVRPERLVHRDRTDVVGIAMQMLGTVSVLCTQEKTATCVVKSSCETVSVGDLIRPFEAIPIPLASEFKPSKQYCEAFSERPAGRVLYSKYDRETAASEDLVNVDMGAEHGLVPGDFLVTYRVNELGPDYPATVLGDLVVLLVEEQTATAKVVFSYSDIRIGDSVRLR